MSDWRDYERPGWRYYERQKDQEKSWILKLIERGEPVQFRDTEPKNYYAEYIGVCQELANLREALAAEKRLRMRLERTLEQIDEAIDNFKE